MGGSAGAGPAAIDGRTFSPQFTVGTQSAACHNQDPAAKML
jgi:hypothetical protein